jgi:hypothetical protein
MSAEGLREEQRDRGEGDEDLAETRREKKSPPYKQG